MYVCICRAVTDRDIHSAVRKGQRSLACLQESTGVGSACGRCREHAQSVLDEACRSTCSQATTPR